jgi:hypothetical protein
MQRSFRCVEGDACVAAAAGVVEKHPHAEVLVFSVIIGFNRVLH